jgi:hypothetical protein
MSQTAMAAALGGAAQSTSQRWETSPEARSSLDALEKAKAVYKKKTGHEWVWKAEKPVTREEFDSLVEDFEDACAVIQFLLSQVPPGSRPGVLPRKFRATS